jgi:hypothetical protein
VKITCLIVLSEEGSKLKVTKAHNANVSIARYGTAARLCRHFGKPYQVRFVNLSSEKNITLYMAFLKSLPALLILLFFSHAALCQDVAGSVRQQWEAYHTTTLQEKMYVHTDKSTYVAGEIIWFKLYNVDAAQHTPLQLSKVAYVDVLDASNKAVAQAKISLKEGKGSGSVLVPLSVASGSYSLRGYTNWMKNFGAGHFFEKPVAIINTLRNAQSAPADTTAYQVALFPEGGNLVNGIESNVAVKVSGPDGKGVHFTGTLSNENGDNIATVSSPEVWYRQFSVYTRFRSGVYYNDCPAIGTCVEKTTA